MRKLGAQTLDQIEKLITTRVTDKKPQTSPPKSRNKKSTEKETTQKTPIKQMQNTIPEKPSLQNHRRTVKDYQPLQKQNKLMERQVKAVYNDMDYQHNHKIQNRHSYFLNSKNPKPPIYQRAKQIVRERELLIQQKRREIQRLKEDQQQQEYQKFLAQAPPKKVISKTEAYDMSERLYKDHYSKLHRLNKQKMQRMQKQSELFREKPQINQNSREIFELLKEKVQLQKNVFNRMDKYTQQRSRKQTQKQKEYKEKYFPFKPVISENSRILTEAKTDSDALSRGKHCTSCIWLRTQKSHTNLTYSPSKSSMKRSYQRQSPPRISQFK